MSTRVVLIDYLSVEKAARSVKLAVYWAFARVHMQKLFQVIGLLYVAMHLVLIGEWGIFLQEN